MPPRPQIARFGGTAVTRRLHRMSEFNPTTMCRHIRSLSGIFLALRDWKLRLQWPIGQWPKRQFQARPLDPRERRSVPCAPGFAKLGHILKRSGGVIASGCVPKVVAGRVNQSNHGTAVVGCVGVGRCGADEFRLPYRRVIARRRAGNAAGRPIRRVPSRGSQFLRPAILNSKICAPIRTVGETAFG
jgi:hypothetical protein